VNLQVYPVIPLIFSKFSFCIFDREHGQLKFYGHGKVMFMLTFFFFLKHAGELCVISLIEERNYSKSTWVTSLQSRLFQVLNDLRHESYLPIISYIMTGQQGNSLGTRHAPGPSFLSHHGQSRRDAWSSSIEHTC
jgi:hypothetical protein